MVKRAGSGAHELMIPPAEEALVASPTWVRSSEQAVETWQPVSLVMALEDEPADRHAGMVSDHRDVLEDLTGLANTLLELSLIHISEPTRRTPISYAVFCLKKKNKKKQQ